MLADSRNVTVDHFADAASAAALVADVGLVLLAARRTSTLLGDPPDLDAAFATMYQQIDYNGQPATPWANTPVGDFAELDEQLRAGENVEAIAEQLAADLRLGVEAFRRLMDVRARLTAGEPTEPADAADVVDILVQAQKDACRELWRTEEQSGDVLLEPAQWWVSLTEPQAGAWPPDLPADTPLIDPGRDELTDLPDIASSGRAGELWTERVERLAEITDALRAEWQAGNYPDMLLLALGSPGQTANDLVAALLALQDDLASPDPAKVAAATATITTDLRLSVEDFQFLLRVHAHPGRRPRSPADRGGVPLDDLLALDDRHTAGDEVQPRLDQLTLPFAAFQRLVAAAKLLAQAPLLTDEWDETYSILVQVRKRRLATRWREGERALGLALGPDEFRIPPVDPDVFPPPDPPELPVWRATTQDLSAWRDMLRSRIEQEETTITALADIVSTVEEQTLPALRDAMVTATTAAAWVPLHKFFNLESRATWLTKRLLIDAKAGGCQLTTRIAQAIETMQGILFAARTGELSDVYPDLELDADNFDIEWETLGSYATWRGAMLVHLYPELILAPSLRQRATPAFRALVRDTRVDGQFTAGQACAAARTYTDYLKDVANLDVQASCEARTRLTKGGPCAKTDAGYQGLLHMYAIAKDTRRAYWSTYDPPPRHVVIGGDGADAGYRQSFWDTIPGLEHCVRLIGTAPYQIPASDERHIYLFAITMEKGVRKLVFTRYDLEGGFWDEEPTELELPESGTQFGAVVMQVTDDDNAPLVAIRVPTGAIYWRRLDVSGGGWREGEWEVVVGRHKGREFAEILAIVQRPGQRYLFVRRTDGQISFRVVAGDVDGMWWTPGHSDFRGIVDPSGDGLLTYAYEDGSNTSYRQVDFSPGADQSWGTIEDFEKWLGWRLGMSLHQVEVPEYPYIAARTLFDLLTTTFDDFLETALLKVLRSFLPDSEADHLVKTYLHAVQAAATRDLQTKINEADSNEVGDYGPWKHADWLVRKATKESWWIGRVLNKLVAGESIAVRLYLDHGSSGALPGVGRLATTSRDQPGGNGWLDRAYQSTTTSGPRVRAIRYHDGDYEIHGDYWQTAPRVKGPFEIPNHLSGADLQTRRSQITGTWTYNAFPRSLRSNLTYLEEAYYFIPIHLATQLSQDPLAALDWLRTVYDYAAPKDDRKIYPGLRAESELDTEGQYDRRANWLLDPLNPHAVAETRKDAYTRYTILTIVNLLLNWADAEFTIDDAESVPRARGLYQLALDLLGAPELAQTKLGCAEVIGSLEIEIKDQQWSWATAAFKAGLSEIKDADVLAETITQVRVAVDADQPWDVRFTNAQQIIAAAKTPPAAETLSAVLDKRAQLADRLHAAVLSQTAVDAAARRVASCADQRLVTTVSFISGIAAQTLVDEPVALPWLRERETVAPVPADTRAPASHSDTVERWYNPVAPTRFSQLVKTAAARPVTATKILFDHHVWTGFLPTPTPTFCIPPNPILKAMRLRAELNLYKIRTCRNIEGMSRQLEPYAAPTDTESGLPFIGAGGQLVVPGAVKLLPTQYRYPVLVERAKQLVGLAQQVESLFFAALQGKDAERYTLLRAKQDLGLARAGVQLQQLRVTEAGEGVTLAELQEERAQIQVDHFTDLLEEPISEMEAASLGLLRTAMSLYQSAAIGSAIPNIIAGMANGSFIDFAGIYSNVAQAMSTQSQMLSAMASYQRRTEQWRYEKTLAEHDVKIGRQQVRIAQAHERVVMQEQTIAELQQDNAEATVDFLTTKFTGVELWSFMVGELERVYAHLLRHATAVAKLAENQLAFERQQLPPVIIQNDYWTTPVGIGTGEDGPDRRGLTGSARLLADLTGLDQYAFETTTRKLQLTKTISLAAQAPAEFQQFRQTGVMNFTTTLRDLDREFPGHYLRLIHRVRTNVIALIPPTEGIRATLSAAGTSRLVIGGDIFQTVTAYHGPQSVALTAARDATGVFELNPQPELLAPFEGIGMEAGWELRLPKAANPHLDYRTIADVLVTFEYTALDSFDFRQQVLLELPTSYSGDRPYSFRHQLADQWFDLHNPAQSDTPMTVRFQTRREDFPPNLDQLKIAQVALYFALAGEPAFEITGATLRFTEQGATTSAGGAATTSGGVASTLKGNAGAWTAILGKEPVGTWELKLPNTAEVRNRFKDEQIEDILVVITFAGQLPSWPA